MTLAAWVERKDPKIQKAMEKIASLKDTDKNHRVRSPFPWTDRAPIKEEFDGEQIKDAIEIASKVNVPIKSIVTVQHSVDPLHVAAYVLNPSDKSKPAPSGVPVDLPIVLKYKGQLLLWDGNHRTTAHWSLGDKTVKARVADLDAIKKTK